MELQPRQLWRPLPLRTRPGQGSGGCSLIARSKTRRMLCGDPHVRVRGPAAAGRSQYGRGARVRPLSNSAQMSLWRDARSLALCARAMWGLMSSIGHCPPMTGAGRHQTPRRLSTNYSGTVRSISRTRAALRVV